MSERLWGGTYVWFRVSIRANMLIYTPPNADAFTATRQLHVFCDASERAYGSVSYLRTVDGKGNVHIAFILACSRIAPKKCLLYAETGTKCCFNGCSTSQVDKGRTHHPYARHHMLVRFHHRSSLATVGIMLLQGVCWNACGTNTDHHRPSHLEVCGFTSKYCRSYHQRSHLVRVNKAQPVEIWP